MHQPDCSMLSQDSWFRMKHRSRLEREAREDEEIAEMNKQNEKDNARIKIINARLEGLKNGKADDDAGNIYCTFSSMPPLTL